MLDMTDSIAPKSDQMNSDDLLSGPRTFTVSEVRKAASAEQPVDIVLAEFPAGRPFKPSKSMRRVMVAAWGRDASAYAGKRMTLYRDPAVKFGGQDVGGIRISAMSHLDKPLIIPLTVTRGKKAAYKVDVLADSVPTSPVVSAELLADLTAMFERKGIPESTRLAGVNSITGGSATDIEVITEAEARQVLSMLAGRPDVAAPAPTQAAESYAPAPPAESDELPVEEPPGWGDER